MIFPPSRLEQVLNAVEKGERVDPQKVATLQALDLVLAGRQFVEAAIKREEEADDRATKPFLGGRAGS